MLEYLLAQRLGIGMQSVQGAIITLHAGAALAGWPALRRHGVPPVHAGGAGAAIAHGARLVAAVRGQLGVFAVPGSRRVLTVAQPHSVREWVSHPTAPEEGLVRILYEVLALWVQGQEVCDYLPGFGN